MKTALEFENYKKKLFRLPCGACEHNSIRFNTRSPLGRKMHARDKMRRRRKTSFSISLLSSKLTIFFYSIYKHDVMDIAYPSSMQDACHTWTSQVESPWLSGRELERGIRRTEVRFLMGTQNFYCFTLVTRQNKTSFSSSLPSSKLTIFLILFKRD